MVSVGFFSKAMLHIYVTGAFFKLKYRRDITFVDCYRIEATHIVVSFLQAHLAFTALKDRRAIGKVMITFDGGKIVKSKL